MSNEAPMSNGTRSDSARALRRRAFRCATVGVAAALLAPAGPAAPARAGDAPPTGAQVVAHGKAATGLLVVPGEDGTDQASGTAFCVDPAGFFVTNQHVTEGAATGDYTLLMRPGEPDQKTYTAHVVRTDKDADLSLLKVDGASGLAALPLEGTTPWRRPTPSRPTATRSARTCP